MDKNERLEYWRERLATADAAAANGFERMDERDDVFRGKHKFKRFVKGDEELIKEDVAYVYNAAAETIEAQVSSDIPMPKVQAVREQDEHLAVIIEQEIRNQLDRLPFEMINDLAERVVPVQGGGFYQIAWDNRQRTHNTIGELDVSFIHPKWVVPQEGIYTGVEDMEYIFLKIPQTKEAIEARYDVDVSMESESEPDIKNTEGDGFSDGMVTQYVAYYRNDIGGIGMFSWCNDKVLLDLEDYQATHVTRCAQCGALEPAEGLVLADGRNEPEEWHEGDPCPVCGGRDWLESAEEYDIVPWETVHTIRRSDGTPIWNDDPLLGMGTPLAVGDLVLEDFTGVVVNGPDPEGLKIPYYKPNVFPVVLQRNVSVFGQLLGESDIDKIESLQDGLNRLNKKIFDRFLKAGTKISLPPDPTIEVGPGDGDVIRLKSVADKNYLGVYDFAGDLEQEMVQVNTIYQQMRQTIGVTDSFQGRLDRTATSGKAKEFSAAQAAGRLESKRVMKEAAYAVIFELMFKFTLAYAEEPRPVVYEDAHGKKVYTQFNKWDFLERDDAGDFWWNDRFLFSCDTSSPLASNRERMWQETTGFLTAGAYGDPTKTETLVEYWRKMEVLHYPGAAETRRNMEERLEREQMQAQPMMPVQTVNQPQVPAMEDGKVEELARQQAMQDVISRAAAGRAAAEAGI